MEQKPWYTSKTFWFNILAALWQFIGPVVGIPTLDAETFATVVIVVNMILRAITKGAVSIS